MSLPIVLQIVKSLTGLHYDTTEGGVKKAPGKMAIIKKITQEKVNQLLVQITRRTQTNTTTEETIA